MGEKRSAFIRILSFFVGVALLGGALSARAYTVIFTDATAAQLAGPVNNLAGATLTGAGSLSAVYTSMAAWSPWGHGSDKVYLYAGLTDYSNYPTLTHLSGAISYTLGGLFNRVEFLAGSPDDYNRVQFFREGQLIDTVFGTEWLANGLYKTQHVIILALDSGEFFDEIRFFSSTGAFEFANVSVTPVPLPASVWLFLSAIAGLIAIGRRRKMVEATA